MESESNPVAKTEGEGEGEVAHDAPAHHPSAPPDELFEISTTVDPSYLISLIRKLIPPTADNNHNAKGADGKMSNTDYMEECGGSLSRDQIPATLVNQSESMKVADDFNNSAFRDGEDSSPRRKQPGVLAKEETWEEYGCILWDLAASRTNAELMVHNFILEVLLAHLMVSQSVRITEICLGIIGNLACHEVPSTRIVSTNGLIDIIIDQLFLDDTQCLSEACRLLTLGLQGDKCSIWAEALRSEHVLGRVMWVAENTLNPQVLQKVMGLLLAILESEEVSSFLLPSLMKLGLSSLLINLFSSEIITLTSGRQLERYAVLDVILGAIEALSISDGHSQEICSSKELFQLVCDLVKHPDKVEVAKSCATVSVLIANILSDVPDYASELSHDLTFLQGLLDIFPLASDDLEARSALWSIISRLLVRVKETDLVPTILRQYVEVLVSKTDLIEDDLLDQQLEDDSKETQDSISSSIKSYNRNTALQKIVSILNRWTALEDSQKVEDVMEEHALELNVGRLLDCCCKHIK